MSNSQDTFCQQKSFDGLDREDWILGATNLDEDLHFSSYYLRASSMTNGLYPGFSKIIGFYKPFVENYYVLRDDCSKNSEYIIQKALQNPNWFLNILDQIFLLSNSLASIFPEDLTASRLHSLSSSDLYTIYLGHFTTHSALYQVARLPEALDRGIFAFTKYLNKYLMSQGVSEDDLSRVFNILIQPTFSSKMGEYGEQLIGLSEYLKESLPNEVFNLFLKSPFRARLLFPNELNQKIFATVESWKFYPYHGYGDRHLLTFDDFLMDIHTILATFVDRQFGKRKNNLNEVQKLYDLYRLDESHQQLFSFYPKIEAAKIYRRYCQLKNFYFLDLLLSEMASRFQLSEWAVRCMLPEEIFNLLQAGIFPNSLNDRLNFMAYVIIDGKEEILIGKEAKYLHEKLLQKEISLKDSDINLSNKIKLVGTVVSVGKQSINKSICKIVNRREENSLNNFSPGSILVSHAADPDLFPYIIKAGAVITEEGGVTSHASILCRELGIPAIMGVKGLCEYVHDGDTLCVDTQRGTIEIEVLSADINSIIIPYESASIDTVGIKAFNLIRCTRAFVDNNLRVPEFVILDFKEFKQKIYQGSVIAEIAKYIRLKLTITPNDELSIRSSAITEDKIKDSKAGQFLTYTKVLPSDLESALQKYAKETKSDYSGSVIVQKMISPDLSGVCFTQNPVNKDNMIIEYVEKYNFGITHGEVVPNKLEINRVTGDVEAEANVGNIFPSFLIKKMLDIETAFGSPLDIEWAVVGETLYILQIRFLS